MIRGIKLRCPILLNWGFRGNGSCKRQFLCDRKRLTICLPIRQKLSKVFLKLRIARDNKRIKVHKENDRIKKGTLSKELKEIEEQIRLFSNVKHSEVI